MFLSVPPDIQTLTCIPLNTTAVNVTITPPATGIISEYHLTINSSMSEWDYSNNSSGINLTYVFENLSPGVEYDVWAYTMSGDVPGAGVTQVTCRTGKNTTSYNVNDIA